MKRAIFYLTYNGVYNNTNGIGTQTNVLLSGLVKHYRKFQKQYGDFDVHVIVPTYDESVFGFDKEQLVFSTNLITELGGEIHYCNSVIDAPGKSFWSVDNWHSVSESSASIILQKSKQYSEIIVICVDPPFLHVPIYIERSKKYFNENIFSLITLYTSSYIHDKQSINLKKLEWEYSGVSSSRLFKDVKLAKVCNYMKQHYIEYYGCDSTSFVPYESSLLLEHQDFIPMNEEQIRQELRRYEIPEEKEIILAFGRAAWIKGFDVLLRGITGIKDKVHLVLIVVPFDGSKDISSEEYVKYINENNIDCTFLLGYNRLLPIALSQWSNTKAVVCPSRGEPFSNIPLEVGIWAKEKGPVIIASDVDGYQEQITDGENGFLYPTEDHGELSQKIQKVLDMDAKSLDFIRKKAYNKVVAERDFFKNFGEMLSNFWK